MERRFREGCLPLGCGLRLWDPGPAAQTGSRGAGPTAACLSVSTAPSLGPRAAQREGNPSPNLAPGTLSQVTSQCGGRAEHQVEACPVTRQVPPQGPGAGVPGVGGSAAGDGARGDLGALTPWAGPQASLLHTRSLSLPWALGPTPLQPLPEAPGTATRGPAALPRGWSLSHPHLEPSRACPLAAGHTLSKTWVPVAHTSPRAALPQRPRLHLALATQLRAVPGSLCPPPGSPGSPPLPCLAARLRGPRGPCLLLQGPGQGHVLGVGVPAVLGGVEPQQVFLTCSWAAGRGDQAWSTKPPRGARQPAVCLQKASFNRRFRH